MPVARVHNVVIFTESLVPGFKAATHFYYVFKVHKAKELFKQEFPRRKILRVLDLGVSEVEFSQEKYDALYKDE